MYSGNTTGQVEGLRRQAIGVLDEIVENAGRFELAEPPAPLKWHRQRLREDAYKVLVVGEAKRGKSTFVNALIGRDILPTDVGVATSQVFNVRPSEREACRLRFEDGSVREIAPRDLPLYGSQVMHDAGVVPTPGQIIRWIEVDVPIQFLPQGVSILDTPGLGALYAGHARITHRFVPEADAVIFVLDSGQPVVHEDLRFIEEILGVTRNIFFVQTKIDQYNKEDWQNIQQRNEQILAERFGNRLADTRVWPVSSTNLRKAAAADGGTQDAYLMVSRHNELMAALQAFLARAAGWERIAEAMSVGARYHTASRQALAGRLAGLEADTGQQQSELQNAAMAAKQRFEAEWGMQGAKYRELTEGLQRAIAVGKQSFLNTLQAGSDIELAQKKKIDAVKSLKDANRIAEEMPGLVVSATMSNWARTCKEVQYKCVMLLGPFAEAADNAVAPLDSEVSGLMRSDGGPDKKFKHDYFTMFRGATGGGMTMMSVSGIASVAGLSLAGTAIAAAAPFVAIPALVVLMGTGIKGALGGQVKVAQGQLRNRLHELLQKVRRHFFDVDLMSEKFSRVDEYFMALDRAVKEQVQEMAVRKSAESQAEITRLTQAMQMGEQEREARVRQAREQLARWDEIGRIGGAVMDQIKALERPGTPVTA